MRDSSLAPLLGSMRVRVWLAGCLLASAGAALWMPSIIGRVTGVEPVFVTLAGLLILGLASLLVIVAFRCPSCGKSLSWHAVSKHAAGQWLNWLMNVHECPACHHRTGHALTGARESSDPFP